MKRFPAFDPPEYVAFRPDRAVLDEYRATLAADPKRRALVAGLTPAALLRMYEGMLRFRLHDITLKRWVRQGVISKAWLGTGEEAVSIGTTHALEPGDLVGPMILAWFPVAHDPCSAPAAPRWSPAACRVACRTPPAR